jgi:hypothetical protein
MLTHMVIYVTLVISVTLLITVTQVARSMQVITIIPTKNIYNLPDDLFVKPLSSDPT